MVAGIGDGAADSPHWMVGGRPDAVPLVGALARIHPVERPIGPRL